MKKRVCGCLVMAALLLMNGCGSTDKTGESNVVVTASQESASGTEDTKAESKTSEPVSTVPAIRISEKN